MDSEMDRVLGLVMDDVRTAPLTLPRIEVSSWQDAVPAESRFLYAADASGMGVWLDLRLTGAAQLAHLADQVQEWVIEELARVGQPTNWPACPSHPHHHPMQAAVSDSGLATWSCPRGAPGSWPIGQLRQDDGLGDNGLRGASSGR